MTSDPPPEPFDPGRLFRALESHKVHYLVVGGISARAFGAQRRTYDLDCIPEPSTANITALTAALRQLNARLRIDRVSDAESRELPVDVEHVVRTQEVSLWQTDAGPIDVLHGLRYRDGQQHDYRDLQARAVTLQIGEHRVQLASLDDLIAAKEWAGRPKDREVVDELRLLRANQSSFAESAGRRDDQTPDPRRTAAPPSRSPRPKR